MRRKILIFCTIAVLAAIFAVAGVIGGYSRLSAWIFVKRHFGNTPASGLAYAALAGNKEALEKIIAQGVPVDAQGEEGYTAMDAAVLRRNKNAVLLLLDHGADPNQSSGRRLSPMLYAVDANLYARNNDTWFAETLVKHGGNPNVPLEEAITSHSLPMVKVLVEGGAVLDVKERVDDPPLTEAASANSYDIVYYLLQKGADPLVQDRRHYDLVDLINYNDANYAPAGGSEDYKPRVIEWLKARGVWMDKGELWKQQYFIPQLMGRGIRKAIPQQ